MIIPQRAFTPFPDQLQRRERCGVPRRGTGNAPARHAFVSREGNLFFFPSSSRQSGTPLRFKRKRPGLFSFWRGPGCDLVVALRSRTGEVPLEAPKEEIMAARYLLLAGTLFAPLAVSAQAAHHQGTGGPAASAARSSDARRSCAAADRGARSTAAPRRRAARRAEPGARREPHRYPRARPDHHPRGQAIVRHNGVNRFRYGDGREIAVDRRGSETTRVVERPYGTRIITVADDSGHLIRRLRRAPDGREIVVGARSGASGVVGYYVDLPPPVVRIPRERYIVDADRASREDIYAALTAPPVARIDRRYSLDEVRYSPRLLERMPHIDVNSVTFESGELSRLMLKWKERRCSP
jgi:hypothetical protein